MTTEFPSGELYFEGRWQKGSGAEIVSTFPADGSKNIRFCGASAEDGIRAIEAAKKALAEPYWRDMLPFQRAKYLYRIAELIERNTKRISYLQTRDTGKTLKETSALATSAANTFRYFAAILETMDEALTNQRNQNLLTYSMHEPMGVIAAITPWNSPIASDAQKVAPALAAGNAVILKPASWTPMVSLELARIIEESGIPAGLFSVLPGAGSEVGNVLVNHPDVAKVSFTGGTETGIQLAKQAAEKLMPVSLELGGKSPSIVFDDCNQKVAVAGILYGIFSSSGQSCIAGSRVFVQRSIYEEFVEKLVSATRALCVGHPYEARTQLGPLVDIKHRDSVEHYVALAREEGGEILCGGKRPKGAEFEDGAYYLPTIIGGLNNTARVCQEEIFGPVMVVMPFDDENDVIEKSNDSVFGLACGIWSKDVGKCWRIAKAIRAGTVWINTYKQFSISTPFGGQKQSGVGREKGKEGIFAYMQQKAVYQDISGHPLPWADV
ncbi:aldehyde dehydrogenase (plasmid) [Vibrio nigripulchritudo]|uniref:aldehyde dehydrogenase n=1 Tax=Vibrio nigripulchritudo TaxID=28173 RepID=UPI00190B33E3|nr:aldehyde dehydrogenase [Vibrio nigripulchritudo]BCL73675.1 aldehyde dehydrogenase [Vibrio nigripulchritudo]BDU35046.1 aldehyde dehydrogenase [Vibrio nigripulchritudo]